MASVFLNYRREDSSGYAGRIFDRLISRFGREQIFRDIDRIEPGLDFTEVIDQSLKSCVAVLVLIGPKWLELRNEEGELRLNEPLDFVRFEIEEALKRGVRVIPVLVPGMRHVPTEEELPESIRKLNKLHVFRLTEESWDAELNKLAALLEKLGLSPIKPKPQPAPKPGLKKIISYGLMGLGGLAAIGMVAELMQGDPPIPKPAPPVEQRAPEQQVSDYGGGQTANVPQQEPEVPSNRGNITRLQRGLSALGYYSGGIDGISGPQTSNALLAYQHDEGMTADGQLTSSLLRKMDQASAAIGVQQQTVSRAAGISVGGLWYNNEGYRIQVEQNGNRISATSYDALGNFVGKSQGTINGTQITYSYQLVDGTTGQGIGLMQSDNQHINVVDRDSGALFTESNQLHRGHLPSGG